MKLRNKKTGEIGEFNFIPNEKYPLIVYTKEPADAEMYDSLARLNEDWEDTTANDIKYYYCISTTGGVHELVYYGDLTQAAKDKMAIGNYFSTRKEAEKAVEFLKALKKLKDNGIRFELNIVDYDLKIRHKRLLDDIEAKGTYEALKRVAGVND